MKLERTHLAAIALGCCAVLAAGGYALYRLGMQRGMGMAAAPAPAASASAPATGSAPAANENPEDATRRHMAAGLKAGDTDPANGRRILYYHDPMVPGNRFDKPGKSPFMAMMLYPVYADAADGDTSRVTVSPRMQQNLGVRTAIVTEGSLAQPLAAVGTIAFDEREQVLVQARANGFLERLHVRATLDPVAAGQPLAELHVPEWVALQEEYLLLRRQQGPGMPALVDASLQRMRQAGMSEAQVDLVRTSGGVQARFAVTAPTAGVVTELAVREGSTVMAGATLMRINGLQTVWAQAEVPESLAAQLRPGARVQARTPALPGQAFEGQVQTLLPEVDLATRTRKARVQLANPGRRLVPGMFVQMTFASPRTAPMLLVPSEAVIQTGRRTVVMLAEPGREGGEATRFRAVEIEAGTESGGQTEVRRGLQAGQRVVVSSQFLIDSEASLRGLEARLNTASAPTAAAGPAAPAAAASAPRVEAEGRVEAVAADALTLEHDPVPSLRWPAMTMNFKPPAQLPPGLKAGDRVAFEFYLGTDDVPTITRLRVLPAAPRAASGARP